MSDYSVINVKNHNEKKKEFDVSDIESQNGKTIRKENQKKTEKKGKGR